MAPKTSALSTRPRGQLSCCPCGRHCMDIAESNILHLTLTLRRSRNRKHGCSAWPQHSKPRATSAQRSLPWPSAGNVQSAEQQGTNNLPWQRQNMVPLGCLREREARTMGCYLWLEDSCREGIWCSGITPAQHAGDPGLNPQRVHLDVSQLQLCGMCYAVSRAD